jgi:hypothetical protein
MLNLSLSQFVKKSSNGYRHNFRRGQKVMVHKQFEDCAGVVVAVYPNAVVVKYWSEFYREYRIGSFHPQYVGAR